jgi:hypothetical protein
LQFRYRGSRRESAVAQLFSLGHVATFSVNPQHTKNMTKEKPVKYALHIRGSGGLGPIKCDMYDISFLPPFQVGQLVLLRGFDFQYESGDLAIVKEVRWDFLSESDQTVIHQYVTILEETYDETAQRSSHSKGLVP